MNVVNLLDENETEDTVVSKINDKVTVCIENQVNLRNRIDECVFRLKAIEADLLDVKLFLNDEMNRKSNCTEDKKRKSNSFLDVNMVSGNTNRNEAELPDDIIQWFYSSKKHRSSSLFRGESSSDLYSSGDFISNNKLQHDNIGKVAKVNKKTVMVQTHPDSNKLFVWNKEDVSRFDMDEM